jgi:hypothetical protein
VGTPTIFVGLASMDDDGGRCPPYWNYERRLAREEKYNRFGRLLIRVMRVAD